MIIGIVAIAKNYAIGKDGKLPWHYSADLKFFKETTVGNAVVMGSNTWRSIGKALPNRLNIVLSRSGDLELPEGMQRFASKEQTVEFAKTFDKDVFVIGGAGVFESFADVIEKWLVTDVPVEVTDADVFIPRDFLDGFEQVETRDLGDGLGVRVMLRK